MTALQKELNKVLDLLEIEKQEDQRLYLEYLAKSNIHQRKKSGVCWHPLNIIETGYGLGDYPYLVVERTKLKGEPHQFTGGKLVSLFLLHNQDTSTETKGTIHYVEGDKLKVTLFADEIPYWVQGGSIGINLLFDEKSYKEMEKGLTNIISSTNPAVISLAETIYGLRDKKPTKDLAFNTLASLNKSQNEAVKNCVQSQDISIIHGPPGTGKTTTLVATIQELVKRNEKVLVCAPSNTATDLLTEKIATTGLNVTRIGNLSRIDESITSHTLDHLVGQHSRSKEIKKIKKEAAELRRMASSYKRNFGKEEREQRKLLYKEAKRLSYESVDLENYIIEDLLDRSEVVTATLVGANHRYLQDLEFDTVVIDEAAQGLEPATWIPIIKGKKVILAGDPFQLPPTVKSYKAAQSGLETTLIEKGIQRLDNINLLNVQYRMNENIMAFSNEQFYANQLIADSSVATTVLKPEFNDTTSIEFIDTAGCGFEEERHEENRSSHNTNEAQLILKHLKILIPDSLLPLDEEIGIISPYKAQVQVLDELFSDEEKINYNLTVNTIDSFQGQEKDIIYISLVRSNDKAEIGFLKDYRRMNVAMTRAKKKLIIIGDSATLANDPYYNKFITFVETNEFYKSAWEYLYTE